MRNNLLTTLAITTMILTSSNIANATTPLTAELQAPKQAEVQTPKHDHKAHFEKMSQKLSTELNLTKEQQEKAKLLREEGHKKIEPLMKEMKALRKKMDELRKENMSEFEKILTPEQLDKFKKIKEEGKEKFHKKHHRRPFFDNK
jgi:Spy/CpxP family protein refolding chaperone